MVCAGSQCVPARRVFVTSGVYAGNALSGAAANLACGQLAVNNGLKGTWNAWLSFASPDEPATQWNWSSFDPAIYLVDGTLVADSFTDLVSNAVLKHAINRDENGNPVSVELRVWTGTWQNGTSVGTTDICGGWIQGNPNTGRAGICDQVDKPWWTANNSVLCETGLRLYCFEQ